MKKTTILTTTGLLLLAASCGKGDIQISKQLDKEVTITPDYKDVTIPQNIAPMNFQTSLENPTCVVIEGKGTQLTVHAKDGVFQIPESDWKKLLADNAGAQGDWKSACAYATVVTSLFDDAALCAEAKKILEEHAQEKE